MLACRSLMEVQMQRAFFVALLLAYAHVPAYASVERFVFISHAPDSDSWWNTVKNGIRVAEQQMGVRVEYRNPPTGDLVDMARIVQQAAASRPDGIVVTIADFDVLAGPIKSAVARGIAVITTNSGSKEQSEELGALLHVGQPPYEAGLRAGQRAKAKGISSFLCVNHYVTNPASTERCRGFADALGVPLAKQMLDSGYDPAEVKNRVLAYLKSHPHTEAVLTLGPTSAEPTLAALRANGMSGKIFFGTFDLSEEITRAIKAGVISFAIDQQPYLQGYMPIVLLTNLARYGVLPSGHISSGPGFITKENIALIEKHAGKYR